MKEIQDSILSYASSNPYLSPCLKISRILALLYPLYALITELPIVSVIGRYLGFLGSPMYIAYYLGTILCFAKNHLIPLDMAYGCMAVSYLLSLQHGLSVPRLVYICFYGFLTGICISATKKTSQWNRLKETTLQKTAEYAEIAESKISEQQEAACFCPHCGERIHSDMNFCNHCGSPIK